MEKNCLTEEQAKQNVAHPPLLSDVRKQCIAKYFTLVEKSNLKNGDYYLIDGQWYVPLWGCDTIQDLLDDLFARDAYLISVATDLMEACKHLLSFSPEDWPMPLGFDQIAEEARKAIDKATGTER